jgi:hypothetical protein
MLDVPAESSFDTVHIDMFHTFQTATPALEQPSSKNDHKSRRQSSTTHACEECRRRKIRCDGKQPCSHCEWYNHPKLCKYSKKRPRIVPSQRLLGELRGSLDQATKIVERLVPGADLSELGGLSRAALLDVVLSSTSARPNFSTSTSPSTATESRPSTGVKPEETSAGLEALEQEPAADASWDENRTDSSSIRHVSDDVNALSLSVGRQSSYLGVSSIAAALRVISKTTNALDSVIISSPHRTIRPTRSNSPRRASSDDGRRPNPRPDLSSEDIIDAYFAQVHPLIPMIDEDRFRLDLDQNRREDPSWMALINMVLAMGTIAAATAEDSSHLIYYNRAKQYVDLDTFGDGHIEALQALGIMGGYYLHYVNRPNMANGIMGAAIRMACALGLHREYNEQASKSNDPRPSQIKNALSLVPREVRRRTWWSLFCLDTWANTTTGRPSLGRISPGVTVLPPVSTTAHLTGFQHVSDGEIDMVILREEIVFCRIATRVQDRLAEQPLLPFEETAMFDAELRKWYASMPTIMRYPNECPERVKVPRAVVSWCYHNLRVVLHRPVLLNNALRSSTKNTEAPSMEETRLVEDCRKIAGEAIADIRNQWVPNQFCGWNGTWLLFQASMVPLVTLFAEYNRRNMGAVEMAQEQVRAVIAQLEKMERWSLTAARSRDVVGKIYERSRATMVQAMASNRRQQQPREQKQDRLNGHSQHHQPENVHLQQFPSMQHGHLPHAPPQLVVGQRSMVEIYNQQIPPPGDTHATEVLPDNLLLQQQYDQSMGQHDSIQQQAEMSMVGERLAPSFLNQDELNSFWNQIMWGEGDMPGFVVDTGMAGLDWEMNDQSSASGGGSQGGS